MDTFAFKPLTLRTKGDAIAMALLLSQHYNGCSAPIKVDLEQAQEILDFINKNVDLPNAEMNDQSAFLADLSQFLKHMTPEPVTTI